MTVRQHMAESFCLWTKCTGRSTDAANLMKPMLFLEKLKNIGVTTIEEHREQIEKDSTFGRRFQQALVNEPGVEATISILPDLSASIAANNVSNLNLLCLHGRPLVFAKSVGSNN